MMKLVFGLIFTLLGLLLYQPNNAFAQDNKTSVKKQPPTIIRVYKPAKYNRKKKKTKRKVDMSKVPRVIKVVKKTLTK